MEIKVLGTGCPKCKSLEKLAHEAVSELGIDASVVKEEDILNAAQSISHVERPRVGHKRTASSKSRPAFNAFKPSSSGSFSGSDRMGRTDAKTNMTEVEEEEEIIIITINIIRRILVLLVRT